ncbi:MAG: hypothetical protein GY866_28995, partial [Proteobacteria bacterium]|nr:hypothetical protein [Pseudomonadota bacterium]
MAFYQLSLAYFYSDDLLQATANARKAVLSIEDLEPSKIRSTLNVQLALSLIVKGELDEALAIIREAEDIPGNPKAPKSLVFYAYALYYWEKGRKELALQQLLNCLENSLTTHYHLRLVMEKKRIIRPLVEIWAKGKVRDYILKLLDMMKANVGEDLLSIADSGDDKLKAAASEILAGIAPLPTPDLRAEFLGKFEVALGQKAIPPSRWKSKKAKMLFKYLVFKRGKGYVPKEILIELLWPEESPAKTNKRFHVAMASLRKTLEPGLRRGTPS